MKALQWEGGRWVLPFQPKENDEGRVERNTFQLWAKNFFDTSEIYEVLENSQKLSSSKFLHIPRHFVPRPYVPMSL